MSTDTDVPRTRRRPMVQFNVDSDVLAAMDQAAERVRMNRTQWITQVVLAALPSDIRAELDRP
jgi:hypothetical protein